MIFEFLSNLFGFGKAASTEVTQRDAENNTDEMRANAAAKTAQEIDDEATKAVATADLKKERELGAE